MVVCSNAATQYYYVMVRSSCIKSEHEAVLDGVGTRVASDRAKRTLKLVDYRTEHALFSRQTNPADRTRTCKPVRAVDFKSNAYANSATAGISESVA